MTLASDLRMRLAELLADGCDDRIMINPKSGMHKYNGTNCPVPESVCRSSCTFNIPTDECFEHGIVALETIDGNSEKAEAMREECCDRMRKAWSISDGEAIAMFPSGTDAEFLPLLVALSRADQQSGIGKVVSIIVCAGEVGSGSKQAAIGQHFSPFQASGATHKPNTSIFEGESMRIDAVELKLRNEHGKCFDMDELDSIVGKAVEKAIEVDGYSVAVVHMVVGSKTGSLMPSYKFMTDLSTKYGKKVLLVADACQTRMADHGVADLLSADFAVLVTGSKFYGGPPFCGAALLPAGMATELNSALASGGELASLVKASALKEYISASLVPPELPSLKSLLPETEPNLGLLLRWYMSLYHIEAFHEIPDDVSGKICVQWMEQTKQLIKQKEFETIIVREDPTTVAGIKVREEACMTQFHTILQLELFRPSASGKVVRLSLEELKKMHTLMATDLTETDGLPKTPVLAKRFFIAQPVALSSSLAVLRIAIGAPLVTRLHRADEKEKMLVQAEDEELLEKMNVLLHHAFEYE